MTKLAVLADIHGNLPALEAVWEDLSQFDVDHVVVAGDSINWGPCSREVLEFLTERHCVIMRGNHEYYLLDYDTPRAPEAWSGYTMNRWVHRQIGNGWRTRIATWPDTLCLRFPDAPAVRVVHGSPRDHWRGIYSNTSDDEVRTMLAGINESVVVSAHTHLALDRVVDSWRIVNPGSVGTPLDGIPDASYALLESDNGAWSVTHRRVSVDPERVMGAFNYQEFIKEHGVVGHLIMEEFRTARIQLVAFLLWHRAHYPDEPQTFDLLEMFTDDARWEHTSPVYQVNR
ncbi:metallophosphoesterase family protein [soil metagenome]